MNRSRENHLHLMEHVQLLSPCRVTKDQDEDHDGETQREWETRWDVLGF